MKGLVTILVVAALLNGTKPTTVYEGGVGDYDRGYYDLTDEDYPSSQNSDPWVMPVGEDNLAYDYVYYDEPGLDEEPRYVHFVRSTQLGPEQDEDLYMEQTAHSNGSRAKVWDGNGFYFDREVHQDGAGDFDYVTLHEGESDSMMLMIEEYTTSPVDEKTQGIQLFKGWNLVSFNVMDDPYTPDENYFIREIFGPPWGDGWFDPSTDGSGPDAVYEYRFAPPSLAFFPCTTEEPTWTWLWQMEWAYMVHLDEQHLIELSASDWYTADPLTFQPNSAWDDSLDDTGLPPQYVDGVNFWFFLGFSKSRQVQVLPANEEEGPFFDLYDPNGTNYGNQTLRVVKSDDGRCFFPNSLIGDVDGIGYLEPGRGYSLGFTHDNQVEGWPFCAGIAEESIGGGLKHGGGSLAQTASGSTPVHFQFKPRTQWFYPILIDTLAIEGVIPAEGDEVAVFDGSLCVGAIAYSGELPLTLPAWKDDLATPDSVDGYEVGNDMVFKYFDQSENTETVFELPPQTQSIPEEDPCVPRHSGFGMGIYALRSLAGNGSSIQHLPREYGLGQNYPNPFNAETVVPLELPQRSRVKIELFNVRGQNLGAIYDGLQEAGRPKIRCNASRFSSGVYFYRITAEGLERGGKFTDVGKMLLLK